MGFKLASKFIVFATTYLLLIMVTLAPVKANQRSDLPTIGTAGAGTMSIDRERLLGDFYIRQIRAQAPLVEDPVLREYLSDLGNRLVLHSDNVRFPFTFFWVRDRNINAFAFLGGYIGIHTGLIENADDESELASVIAHEIAHVTQRHIARNMERLNEAAPVSIAQIIGGIVLAMANPQLGMAVMTGSMAGMQQRQINYTRQFEIEADRFGMATLARAGFDPHGAPRFFGRLASRYRYSTQVPQFLVTHPLPESRIADTRERAQQLGQVNLEPSLQFELAKARVQVRYTNASGRNALSQALADEEGASHPHTKAAARYAQALALYELNRLSEADEILTELHEQDQLNLFYIDTITDTWIKQERYEEIVDFLTQAYIRRPNNQVLTLNLAFAANEGQQYDLSVKILNEYILRNRDDRLAYQLLHEAHQGAGDAVSMHEAQAELFALNGNFDMAIEELHSAHSKVAEDRTLSRQRIRGRIEQMRKLKNDRERVMRM